MLFRLILSYREPVYFMKVSFIRRRAASPPGLGFDTLYWKAKSDARGFWCFVVGVYGALWCGLGSHKGPLTSGMVSETEEMMMESTLSFVISWNGTTLVHGQRLLQRSFNIICSQ